MRRSAVVLLVLCALSPFQSEAQVNATITGPSSATTGVSVGTSGYNPPECSTWVGAACGVSASSDVGVAGFGNAVGVYAQSNNTGVKVEGTFLAVQASSSEGTAIEAWAPNAIGVNATGGNYGAQLDGGNAQLRLVPAGNVGPPEIGGETGALRLDSQGTLWLCTVAGTYTTPGTWVALSKQGPPAGAITAYAGATVPSGYLLCNGQTVSRTTYAALFAAIGTTYGAGDGSTTFKVPDLRGEFLRGLDGGRGVDTGRALGTSEAAGIAPHWHYGFGAGTGGGTTGAQYATNLIGLAGQTQATVATGSGIGTETRPRNVAVNYLIAY